MVLQQPPSPNSLDLIEEIFTAVVTYHDEKGNQISNDFTILPSRKELADYYDSVERPIDLKQIASKIQHGGYRRLDDIVPDFILMADNAMRYNVPKSPIYNVSFSFQIIRRDYK